MNSHKSLFMRVTAVSRYVMPALIGLFLFILISFSNTVQASSCINVTTESELTNALGNAAPGQVICLADGIYNGNFVITNSGSETSPIILRGSSAAILEGSGVTVEGYGLHLDNVQYWQLEGFTVQNSQKGIILDSSHHTILDGLTVKDVGDEAVHFRTHSTYNRIQNSTISNTGLREPGFGEGVYIGSANSNWCTYTNCEPDLSHYNEVLNNHFGPDIRAEGVDAKEGTLYGLIEGNTFDGSGVSGVNYADSWMDIKADHYTIRNNSGTNAGANAGLTRGFHVVAGQGGDYGNYNHFEGNTLDFNNTCTKRAFFTSGGGVGNTVCGEPNNTVINAGCDFASKDFEILSCSEVSTATPAPGTPTVIPSPTNTPDASVALKVQYQVGDSSATDNAIKPNLRIVNEGGTAVSLNQLTMRYWFTENAPGFNYSCDYAAVGCGNVSGQVVSAGGNDYYIEVSFSSGAGSVAAGANTGNLKNRVNRSDWANFDETNDYSYDASKSSYADWNQVTLYQNGTLVWGVEPGNSTVPTATSIPPTATTPGVTLTPTATSQPPTATATSQPPTPTSPPSGSSDIEVQAKITKDEASKTQYDVKLINDGSTDLSGYSFRVYIDISEILSAGHSASDLRCDENYDASGAGSCSFSQYSGSIYYADVDFGSYSLAANDDVRYKFTIRLDGWASDIDSSNDFSRQGLTGSYQATDKIPVYQGSSLIAGTNP
jgi:hypothetical protein